MYHAGHPIRIVNDLKSAAPPVRTKSYDANANTTVVSASTSRGSKGNFEDHATLDVARRILEITSTADGETHANITPLRTVRTVHDHQYEQTERAVRGDERL